MDSTAKDTQKLCSLCDTINITKYLYDKIYPGTLELGYYQDILSKSQCPLCNLVIQALNVHSEDYWKPGDYPVEMCYLGRSRGESSSPMLEVWFDATSKTLPAGVSGHLTVLGQILPLDATGFNRNASNKPNGHGRPLRAQVNRLLVRSWIEDCALNHGVKCNSSCYEPRRRLDLLLIDVEQMRLVNRDWSTRYLALSYVWGQAKAFHTVKANLEELQQHGALLRNIDKLPRVIKNVIKFVRDIGETHVWVDALCIVQDDPDFKARYISRMDEIYSQSWVTVVALAGQDANFGLPGIADGPRRLVQVPVNLGPLKVVARLPDLFTAEQFSIWGTRAWTFQEGILSKKKIYFSQSHVFWHCRTKYYAEDYSPWTDEDKINFGGTPALEQGVEIDSKRQFNVYQSFVKEYSNRKITYHSDSLYAFTGILSALGNASGWSFASALPENIFDLALLWRPMSSIEIRPRSIFDEVSQPSACKSPTWCWTAWAGNIFWDPWRLNTYANKDVTLRTEVTPFVVEDGTGSHEIAREQNHETFTAAFTGSLIGQDIEVAARCPGSGHHSRTTLYFEARTVTLDLFTVLPPRVESCSSADSDQDGMNSTDFRKSRFCNTLWILNRKGHHCGTLQGIDSSWTSSHDTTQCEFVLLSSCDQDEVTQADIESCRDNLPLEYPSAIEYYEAIFDTGHYEYKRQWAMNILLVEWKGEAAERVAIGQIHADAWNAARWKVKRIILV